MGMSTARRLGQHCRVVLASLSAEKNSVREASLKDDGIDAVAVQCDITDATSVAELARFVAARGRLRTLAHVAALSPSMGDWTTLIKVNLIGVQLVEQAMLALAETHTAAIFVSSLAAHRQQPISSDIIELLDHALAPTFLPEVEALVEDRSSLTAYRLSKIALNRMCRRQASAWGQKGARIVSMSPGFIATPMGALEFQGRTRENKLAQLARTPLQREGTMVETADAIEFLASERASFITGTDLLVDGGVSAALAFPGT